MNASLTLVAILAACTGTPDTGDSAGDSDAHEVTGYDVLWSSDPDPVMATEQAQFTIQVVDQDGMPIGDLQQNHERMVHAIFVSSDLASFTHTHQEDYTPITADNLRNAQFSFPLTLPSAGRYFAMFDYASRDQWLQTEDELTVSGSPPMAASPDLVPNDTAMMDGVTATLAWSSAPLAGYEADWTITLSDANGDPVTDVTQYLGADAHCVVVNSGTTWGSHTHAWFPDMGAMTPTMAMPHLYDGPEIPFAFTFPTGGTYKMWIQLVRSSTPDVVYVLPFVFDVAG